MTCEKTIGSEASYLRRLGALAALLCGVAALLGMWLVALEPAPENVAALVASACVALLGAVVCLRG